MEAFFKNDEEIREWVDLFIEKLFTVNLLTGNDADSEFIQGRQAVEKIVQLFREMIDMPKDILVDGIRQLVEQRLPDPRVIENFPDFYLLMNDMINAGLQNIEIEEQTIIPQQVAGLKNIQLKEGCLNPPSSKVILTGGHTSAQLDSSFSLRSHLLKTLEIPQTLQPPAEGQKNEEKPIETSELPRSDCGRNDKVETQVESDAVTVEESKVVSNSISQNISEELNRELNSELCEGAGTDISTEANKELSIELNEDESVYYVTRSLHELIDESMKQLLRESQTTLDEYTSALIPGPISVSSSEFDSIPAMAKATCAFPPPRDPFRFNTPKKKSAHTEECGELIAAPQPIASPQQVPLEGKWLAQSLKHYYPGENIQWNYRIEGQHFLAKIDKLLVYIFPEESTEGAEKEINEMILKMQEKGFRIFTCYKEDLAYPRRLEREIRRFKR